MITMPSRLDRLSDDALLVAFGLGGSDAAAVFVRRFQRKVYGVAYLITHDRFLAEDAAQQAFERAWKQAGAFDSRRGTVVSWLLVITRNAAIDMMRVRRPEPIDPAGVLLLLQPALSPDPEEKALRTHAIDRIRPAFHQLPIEQRRAVLLSKLAGHTAIEIAEIENVPVPTAKTRLRSGLAKLQMAAVSRKESHHE
jgi:RNA polymerase sigma factor (sigma-70 family)